MRLGNSLTTKRISFLFQNYGNAKIIAGQVEGIYGWVTVNFLLDVFALKDSTSYGSLEMEGASHQNSRGSDKVALLLLFLTWLRKNKGVLQLDIVI